jgi:histidine triad (HIT) family protein
MENCIFCKIIKGDIPCYRVLENEKVLAFLDINPVMPGHTLVIPKKHFIDISEIEEDYLKEVILMAKKIADKMIDSSIAEGVDIFQANKEAGEQTVFHYHMHIIPRKRDDGIDLSKEMIRNAKKLSPEDFGKIQSELGMGNN